MNVSLKVIAVVVTYNRKELLKECIEGLLAQKVDANLSIQIIDNASTDGTRDYIDSYIEAKKIKYLNTGANLGGAGGFEKGIREVSKDDYDFVWIMDDDTIPTESALSELISAASELSLQGFLSSLALWTDGSICTMNVQRKDIMRKLKMSEFKKKIIPVQYATFVSLFIPMRVVKEVGAPIGDFFIWGDDWEYTRRISKKYKSYVVTSSQVVHKTATNIGCDISSDQPERIQRYRYAFRNEAYVGRQDGLKGRIYSRLKVIKNIGKVLFKSKTAKKERLDVIFEGIKEGKSFNPEIKLIGK